MHTYICIYLCVCVCMLRWLPISAVKKRITSEEAVSKKKYGFTLNNLKISYLD